MVTDMPSGQKSLGILGTGQFAKAFSSISLAAGYSVTMGSRRPEDVVKTLPPEVKVTSYAECVGASDVIVVALPAEHFESVFTTELSQLCAGKILVDVSNRQAGTGCCRYSDGGEKQPTNARALQDLAPQAAVVKAFNTLSAFYLQDFDVTGGESVVAVVVVAGDDQPARARVVALARDLGFEPRMAGGLEAARAMEEGVHRLFPQWRLPLLLTLAVTIFWFVFTVVRSYVLETKLSWGQLPLKVTNKVIAATALTLMALTYLPGPTATTLNLLREWRARKTSARPARPLLPAWLTKWLRSRRQLGLSAFWLLVLHAVMSALVISPTYLSSWFPPPQDLALDVSLEAARNGTPQQRVVLLHQHKAPLAPAAWMYWNAEASLLCAVLALGLAALLAATSLPAVSQGLSWAEWRLVHSGLGAVTLTLGVGHLYFMSFPSWLKVGLPGVLFRLSFASTLLPTTVLFCRLAAELLKVLLVPRLGGRGGGGREAGRDAAAAATSPAAPNGDRPENEECGNTPV